MGVRAMKCIFIVRSRGSTRELGVAVGGFAEELAGGRELFSH